MDQNGRDRGRRSGRARLEPAEAATAAQRDAHASAASDPRGGSERDRDSGLNAVSPRNAHRADITGVEGPAVAPAPAQIGAWTHAQRERFHALYREHFDFVYRNLRRLGVPDAGVDDALQDVYLVVLRHIDGYRPGTHARAWLFAIAMRVAGNYRRARRRRGTLVPLSESEPAGGPDPESLARRSQAGRILHEFLDHLDDDRRAVFVMAELEQMSAPEIALALSANVNTVYSRLRGARAELERMLAGMHRRTEQTDAGIAPPLRGRATSMRPTRARR